jgi:serine/threonine protein kinase
MNFEASPTPQVPDRWLRLEELFHAASALAPADRADFLRRQCGDDRDMLAELEDLLASDSSVSDLMSTPVTAADGKYMVRRVEEDPWTGRVLNGFTLGELLGRGGMGAVYAGTRLKNGLAQRVAVKLMARHLQSTPAQAQFLLERDTLAALAHRNIASLVDGGVTQDGIPYLMMEFIEGRRLDKVADDPETTLAAIAGLMIQLCDAVGYVHRNLILHRDLKPGNVMVTGDGQAKLLDFGTLKVVSADAAKASEMTQAGMRPVTLRYASPEHIRGETGSTALDVYSLGMTLYRLLAGRLPPLPECSTAEYLQLLEHEDFPPPSSLKSAQQNAQRQQPDPELAADLDAIAAKAIRYRPADRYDGADALAADLRRALEKKPVHARVGTLWYRASRFTRRHRLLVAASVMAAIMLTIGVTAMRHEANVARAESLRADAGIEQERVLAHFLLFDYFDGLKRISGSTDAQRRAISQAIQYLDSVNKDSLNPALRLDTIQAYTEMGALQGGEYEENLGDMRGSIATLTKAVSSAHTLVAQDTGNVHYLQSEAAAERALGQAYFSSDHSSKAIELLTEAANDSRHMSSMPGATSAMRVEAAKAIDNLGDALGLPGVGTTNDPLQAIERYKQAAEIYRQSAALDPACASCVRGVMVEDYKLGLVIEDKTQARGFYEDGLRTIASLSPAEQATPRNMRSASILEQDLGALYIDEGKTTEGLAMMLTARHRLQAAVAIDAVNALSRTDLALCDNWLAGAYDDLRQYPEEADALRESIAMMDFVAHKDPTNTVPQFRRAMAQALYAHAELQLGKKEEGERLASESLATLIPMAQKKDAGARALGITADALVKLRSHSKTDALLAASFAQRAIEREQRPRVEEYLTLAEAEHFAGAPDEARRAAQSALKLIPPHEVSLSDANDRSTANALLNGDDPR